MSEDEAFIRAIVDSPGDDTPRLVYADWLDDRDDPRGPYLRAEAEAVAADDIGGLRALRLTALNVAGLDPVWVARVSRPPTGVCCDGLNIINCGAIISEADVGRAERALGIEINGDYRAFLLNYNGGMPRSRNPKAPEQYRSRADECFYSLGDDFAPEERRSLEYQARSYLSLVPDLVALGLWHPRPRDTVWQADVIPIGDTGGDFVLFYAFRGHYAGRLQLHDYTNDCWSHFGFLADESDPPTLPQFLHCLSEYGCTLVDSYNSRSLQTAFNP